MTSFHLIDLVSQREAFRHHVMGWSIDQIVTWLAARGQLSKRIITGRETFFFESAAGRRAVFFVDDNEMIFVGDHTTFT